MKVLVLGGTGAMGAHLTRRLAEDGVETVVTSRRDYPPSGTLRYVKGNARDLAFVQTLLQEPWDAIVDFMVYKSDVFQERLPLFLAATRQYVFLSSSRVYAGSDEPLREDSPRLLDTTADQAYLATDEYALSKAREEDILRRSGASNWTIIRPYITYSETRLQLGVLEKEAWLYRALKGRTIVFSADIAERITTLTYGLNVSDGIRAVLGSPEALGQAYHITADTSLTWAQALAIYLKVLEKHLGRRPNVLLANMATFERTHLGKFQIKYDRLFNRRFDNARISRHIDIRSFEAPESGLQRCLESFLQNPTFDQINWKYEALRDRASREHTPLGEIAGLKQKIRYLVFRYLIK